MRGNRLNCRGLIPARREARPYSEPPWPKEGFPTVNSRLAPWTDIYRIPLEPSPMMTRSMYPLRIGLSGISFNSTDRSSTCRRTSELEMLLILMEFPNRVSSFSSTTSSTFSSTRKLLNRRSPVTKSTRRATMAKVRDRVLDRIFLIFPISFYVLTL